MFQRKVKELNDRDTKLDLGFEDLDEEFENLSTALNNKRSRLQKQIDDKQEELYKLERYFWYIRIRSNL